MTNALSADTAPATRAPFGRVLTAMVTPFGEDDGLDVDGAQRLATHLVDTGNDGLIINGTTGESPTTSDEEKDRLLRAVVEAVGDRARVVAGVGTNDTQHTLELARAAEKAGAHGLLVVTPYYSKPPQSGLQRHFSAAADATGLPVMLYDIPGRTGVQIARETYDVLARNEHIVAVKDAVGDFYAGAWLMRETSLALYSGDDAVNLAWLAYGAAGVVSVVGHVAAREYAAMVGAVDDGDLVTARRINDQLLPAVRGLMTHTQGAITAKASLQLLGQLEHRTVRPPLVDATDDEITMLGDELRAAHLLKD